MRILNIFKQKKDNLDKINNLDNSINLEKDELINKIGIDIINNFCYKFFLTINDLPIEFLKRIKDSKDVLTLLCKSYISYDSIEKIINNTYSLNECYKKMEYYTLKYPTLFRKEDQDKILLLNKDIDILENNYASVEMDNLNINNLSLNNNYSEKINTYFDNININHNVKKTLPIKVNNIYASSDINILFPVDNIYYDYNTYSYFIDHNVDISDKMIIIISLDKFNELNYEELKLFSKCTFVLNEDIQRITELYNKIKIKDNNYSFSNKFNDEEDIIKTNHLLFIIDNSIIDIEKKKYYKYLVCKYHSKKDNYYLGYIANQISELIDNEELNKLTLNFNKLSNEEKKKGIKENSSYDISIFFSSISNIDNIDALPLINKLNELDNEERMIVFNNNEFKDILSSKILNECGDDIYDYFRKLKYKLTAVEIISLFDVDKLKKHFSGNNIYNEYKVFSSLCQNELDTNNIIKYILNDDNMFKEFFKQSSFFYSGLSSLSGKLLNDVLLKLKEFNMDKDCYYFVSCLSSEAQINLINEKLDDDFTCFLVPNFKKEVINYFFTTDKRAEYLFTKFNIPLLITNGITFSDEILKKDEFFDMLKSDSFIEFRNNINNVEKNNLPLYIENKLKKYYDELLNDYDNELGMFKEYVSIINNVKEYNHYRDYNSYIKDDDAYHIFEVNWDNNEKMINEYKKLSNKKISEIVIDALFSDNFYNVRLNIKEMFRFNDKLSNNEKVLDSDKEKFYNMILNFDNISPTDKIKLYNSLKNKNINLMFYEDIRKLKDKSYDMINNELFNLNKNNPDKELSDKYGVTIYNMQDDDFFMLVRSESNHSNITELRRNCYSIISNDNTSVYTDGSATIYGYNSFENDRVLHVFEGDSFSSDSKNDDLSSGSKRVNRIMTTKEITNGSYWYSEVQLVNLKKDDYYYNAKNPDFIVVYDSPDESAIKESKERNIPIVIIKNKSLENDKRVNINGNALDNVIDDDMYINDHYDENNKGKIIR